MIMEIGQDTGSEGFPLEVTLDLSPGGRGKVNQAKRVGRRRGYRQKEQQGQKGPSGGRGLEGGGLWGWRAGVDREWMKREQVGMDPVGLCRLYHTEKFSSVCKAGSFGLICILTAMPPTPGLDGSRVEVCEAPVIQDR